MAAQGTPRAAPNQQDQAPPHSTAGPREQIPNSGLSGTTTFNHHPLPSPEGGHDRCLKLGPTGFILRGSRSVSASFTQFWGGQKAPGTPVYSISGWLITTRPLSWVHARGACATPKRFLGPVVTNPNWGDPAGFRGHILPVWLESSSDGDGVGVHIWGRRG